QELDLVEDGVSGVLVFHRGKVGGLELMGDTLDQLGRRRRVESSALTGTDIRHRVLLEIQVEAHGQDPCTAEARWTGCQRREARTGKVVERHRIAVLAVGAAGAS